MHVVMRMKLPYCNCNLTSIKLDLLFLESFTLQEMFVKLSSSYKRHDKEQSNIVLEDIVHAYEKWRPYIQKNVSFELSAFDGLCFDENVLTNGFDCV